MAALAVVAVACGCGTSATGKRTTARILYASGSTNLEVRTIGADGQWPRVLTTHPPSGEFPTWIDHGRSVSLWGSDGALWLFSSSGSSARRVAAVSDYSTLSPTGRKVAIVTGRLRITDSNGRTVLVVPLKLREADSLDSPEQAAWSPDERHVAFQVWRDTNTGDTVGRVLVVDLPSGRIHTIREGDSVDSEPPAWSPDGRRLAFIAGSISSPNDDLYVSNPDGSDRARVVTGVSAVQQVPFAWSPDGRRFAFVRAATVDPHRATIFVVPARGGTPQRVAAGRKIFGLAWSRDSGRIAFSAAGGIFIGRAGGTTTHVTRLGGRSFIAWAPGKRILFDDGGSSYSIGGDGRTLRPIAPRVNDSWPVWSPDGRAIAFVRGPDAARSPTAGDIWTITARGRRARRAGEGYDPAWSPDSRRLAYVRSVAGKPAIVVQRTTGGRGDVVAHGTSPSWSPDGTLLAYLRGTEVRVVSPSGGHDRVVLAGDDFQDVNGVASEHYVAPIAWAPRGDELAVSATLLEQDGTGDGESVRVAALADGSSRTLPLYAQAGLDWSPDGKTLVGASEEGMATIAADGSDEQMVVPSSWPLIVSNPAWSPDSRAIAYTSCVRERCGIRIVQADGSAQHRVVGLAAPQFGFDAGTSFKAGWQPR